MDRGELRAYVERRRLQRSMVVLEPDELLVPRLSEDQTP